MGSVKTLLWIATPMLHSPTATPTAAIIQTPAALVSLLMSRPSLSLRIEPAPMKPTPVTTPWMTLDSPSVDVPTPEQARTKTALCSLPISRMTSR